LSDADRLDPVAVNQNGTIGNDFMAGAGPTHYDAAVDANAHAVVLFD
jgi:hypothetical protein